MKLLFLVTAAALLSPAVAWGAVGHEVVATIAQVPPFLSPSPPVVDATQIHLHDSSRTALKRLLPDGHLAPIASWADRVRMLPAFRFSGELHYTSPLQDYPPETCYFGEKGWKTNHDVLHAITNYTSRLASDPTDGIALRFLVHFVGDVHQPLHLTDRERGGNGDPVIFEGRHMNLHSLWDTALITKAIREQSNYSTPLPSKQIEDSLRGTIYDPYIRLILWEGVRVWWRLSLPDWLFCSPPLSASSLKSSSQQTLFTTTTTTTTKPWETVCPEEWARGTHAVTCADTFPLAYNTSAPPELNTPSYYGPIRDNNIVERLLAQGGLRLAAALNSIFAEESELIANGPVRLWFNEGISSRGDRVL